MRKSILTLFILTSFVAQSQTFVSDIKLGYDISKGVRTGGWEEEKEKDILDTKYNYKSFRINHVKGKTGNNLKEFNYRGGKIFTLLYLFYDSNNRVVAIREYSKVKFSGSNGLSWFLNTKKRLKDYVARIPEWKELDDVENNNLRRYYSIFIKGEKSSEDRVQVYSINKDFTVKEYYYAKSNYQSINWVSNPYQKIKVGESKEIKKSLILPEKVSKVFYQAIVNLNLRSEPNTNSKVIIMIPKLDAVFSKEEYTSFEDTFSINEKEIKAKWVKVVYGKLEGWLFMGGLKLTDSDNYAGQQDFRKSIKKKQ